MRSSPRYLASAPLAFVLLWSTSATAQDPILDQLYGSGVHEFYTGDYARAIADLSDAARGGSKDPRVYYFRAMAHLKSGETSAAEADMQQGASLESADVNQLYPVSKSLERVQGSGRLVLERHRIKARADAHSRIERRNSARYEQQRRAESEVLRAGPVAPPPAAGAVPGIASPAAKPAGEAPAEQNPFEEDSAAAAPPAGKAPAAEGEEASSDDPFASDDASAAPAASDSPAASGDDDAMGGDDAKGDDDAMGGSEKEDAGNSEMSADDEQDAGPPKAATADEMADDADLGADDEAPAKPAAKAPVAKAPVAKAPVAKAPAKAAPPKAAADDEMADEDLDMSAGGDEDEDTPPAKVGGKKAAATMDDDEAGDRQADDPMADDASIEDDGAAAPPAKTVKPAAGKTPAKPAAGKIPAKVADDDDAMDDETDDKVGANPFIDDPDDADMPAAKRKMPAKPADDSDEE